MTMIRTLALAVAAAVLIWAAVPALAAGPVSPTPKSGLGTVGSTPAASSGHLPTPTIPTSASGQTVPGGLTVGQGVGTATSTPASGTPASGHIGTGK